MPLRWLLKRSHCGCSKISAPVDLFYKITCIHDYESKVIHKFDSNSPDSHGRWIWAITNMHYLSFFPTNVMAEPRGFFLEDLNSSFIVCDCVAEHDGVICIPQICQVVASSQTAMVKMPLCVIRWLTIQLKRSGAATMPCLTLLSTQNQAESFAINLDTASSLIIELG